MVLGPSINQENLKKVSESMYDFASFSRATTQAEICKLATDVIDENHVEGSKQAKKVNINNLFFSAKEIPGIFY